MTNMKINHFLLKALAVLSVSAILFSSYLVEFANAQGYSSAFEGPKATFYGVEYQPPGAPSKLRWSSFQTPTFNPPASLHDFLGTLKFDSDGYDSGKPNIYGEMTTIYLPSETMGNIRPWVPSNWLNQLQYVQNPIGNYTWEIGEKHYGMEAWLCRLYVAFSAEWEGSIEPWGVSGEVPRINSPGAPLENEYSNLAVWLEIDTAPTFYYMNAEATYFAIGKIQLSNPVEYTGHTNQYGGLFGTNVVDPRTTVSLLPESASSYMYIYDAAWGLNGTRQTQYSYQGQDLNPSIFKPKSYIKIDFNKFGIYAGSTIPWSTIGGWVKGDNAVVCFDVTVFTIGEWKVQDVQNDPDNYGRFTRTDEAGGFLSWLLSPATLSWLIPVLIFFALLIFAPWVIVAILGIFRGR